MAWPPALNTAIDLYNTDKHEECITHIRTVLRDNTPNYARVRYYTLLACCLDDWYEVGDMRFHAENVFAHWCLFNSGYPGAQMVRDNLRTSLDELADYLRTFRPEDWKESQRFWNDAEAAEAREEYADEWAEAEEEETVVVVEGEEKDDEDAVVVDGENDEEEDDDDAVALTEGEEYDARGETDQAFAAADEERILRNTVGNGLRSLYWGFSGILNDPLLGTSGKKTSMYMRKYKKEKKKKGYLSI